MYYTYVLISNKDGNFYVGFTKDLKQRFEMHNKKLVQSTKDRTPLTLIKEARETNYWLRLLRDSKLCKDIDYDKMIEES